MQDEALAAELLGRARQDQEARSAAAAAMGADGVCRDAAINARIQRVDRANVSWLRSVLRDGWPGTTRVGEEAADAAWLLCQHADRDPYLQRHALSLLEAAVERGEAPRRHVAYLTDRVLVAQGGPQRYGTQFRPNEGTMQPHPVEDPARLDERRAAMGLEPHADYVRRFLTGE